MRKFVPIDEDTILKEMKDLPRDDFAGLKYAMSRYIQSSPDQILPPAAIEDQGGYSAKYKPIFKIRHRSKSVQGRGFFYFGQALNGEEPLYILLVYKKETDEAPRHLLEAAYQRMLRHREEKNGLA